MYFLSNRKQYRNISFGRFCGTCNTSDCSSFPSKQSGDADSLAQWPHMHQVLLLNERLLDGQSVRVYIIPRGTQLRIYPSPQPG